MTKNTNIFSELSPGFLTHICEKFDLDQENRNILLYEIKDISRDEIAKKLHLATSTVNAKMCKIYRLAKEYDPDNPFEDKFGQKKGRFKDWLVKQNKIWILKEQENAKFSVQKTDKAINKQ